MRLYGVAALVALAGCTVKPPVAEIDDRNAGGPAGCGVTAGFCQTVDADCQLVLADGCTAALTGGQGLCAQNRRLCDSSGACQDDPGNFRPVSPESCDGLDDDCDGVVDDGCDADGDGHCSMFALVIGHPAACPADPVGYGEDCDDGDSRRVPGTTEICNDGVDNDCNGQVDEGCPALSLAKPGLPMVMHPGEQRVLAASMAPDTLVPVASITASSAECDLVTAEALSGAPGLVITVPSVTGLDGCTYVATLSAQGVSASVDVVVEDRAPVIRYVAHARLDGQVWNTTAIYEHQLTLSAETDDPDGQTLSFTWSNADGLLLCPGDAAPVPTCTGGSTMLLWVPSKSLLGTRTGTDVTVTASDGTSTATAAIHVAFDECVWVKSGASTYATGLEADPMGSLTGALEAAWDASAGIDTGVPVPTDVCILGSSTFVLPETAGSGQGLVLDPAGRTGVHHPGVLGGFADTSGAEAILTSTSGAVVSVLSGYTGTLSDLTIDAQGSGSALVVSAASPLVANCTITATASGTGTSTLVGIDVTATEAGASPIVTGGSVRVTGGSSRAVGVRVTDTGPAAVFLTVQGLDNLSAQSGSASATAVEVVAVSGPPAVRLDDCGTIRADAVGSGTAGTAGTDAIAIDAAGEEYRPALEIARNGTIVAAGGSATTAAIRMRQVAGASIIRNQRIAAEGQGAKVAAAILDGAATVSADALSFTPGGSADVLIARNDVVANDVQTDSVTCAGPVVSAAVLLAGSVAPTISDNGREAIRRHGYGGILGGSGVIDGAAAVGTIVPVPAGLWLVDVTGALVTGNEIRAGYLVAGCGDGAASFAVAYRDTGSTESSADPRTTFDGNGASCAFPGTPPSGVADGGCVAARVDGPASGPGPTITNSVLSANRGSAQLALWVRGPSATRAYHDTFDVGALAGAVQPSVREAVRLENTSAGSVELVNDIFLVEGIPDAGALALREVGSTTDSQVGAFEHNLLFLEGDDLTTDEDPPYVRVGPTDVTLSVVYPASDLDALVSERGQGNVTGDPALVMPIDPFLRFEARLSPISAARDRGTLEAGMPAADIDGDARPFVPAQRGAPVVPDIGHDELVY